MVRKKRLATYAFVDASNIIYGARAEGWYIDQKKLIEYLKKEGDPKLESSLSIMCV